MPINERKTVWYELECDKCHTTHPTKFFSQPNEEDANGYEDESQADPHGNWDVRNFANKLLKTVAYCPTCAEQVWAAEEAEARALQFS